MHDFTMCSVSQIQLRSGALCRERCKSEMSMGRPYYNRIAHLDNAKLWIKKLFRFMKPSIILRTLSMDDLFANSLNNT